MDTKYNTVTGPEWVYHSSGIPENLYLKVSNNTEASNSASVRIHIPVSIHSAIASEPVDQELPLFDLNVNIVGNENVVINAELQVGSMVELVATPNDAFTEFTQVGGTQVCWNITYPPLLPALRKI